ncbi:hypothetical protein LG290_12475 [Halomonas sediminis]
MDKIAYTFIAFLASILTLVSASALSQSGDEERDHEALVLVIDWLHGAKSSPRSRPI